MAIGEAAKDDDETLDPKVVARAEKARAKLAAGESLGARDAAAIRRVDLEVYAQAVPKGAYSQWSGRSHKVLDEQAERYGLPISGDSIDIRAVCKWLHDFLASNKYRFIDDDPDIAGASSPALERCRQLKAEQLQIELDKMRGSVVDVSVVRDCLGQLATQLRAASDRAENLFGIDGRELLTQVIDAVCASISKLEDHGDDDKPKQ